MSIEINPLSPEEEFSLIELYIGKKLRAVRKADGISLKQLTEATGDSYQQLGKIETCINHMRAATLFQIACKLKRPVNYFFPPPSREWRHYSTNTEAQLELSPQMLVCDRDHITRIYRIAHMLASHPIIEDINEVERIVKKMTNNP